MSAKNSAHMSFPEIQASLALYQEAHEHRIPPEWYARARTSPAALAEERESGKKFEAAVRAVTEAVAAGAENLPDLVAAADAARHDAWLAHYERRLDVAVRGFEMLQGTPASRYAGFHNGVAKAMKAAELSIGVAKVWDGSDAEDEFKGLRPLVIEAEDQLRWAWDVFKQAERQPVAVDKVFEAGLAKVLAALGMKTVQDMLSLDESALRKMGLGPLQVAEIEAKIGSPRPRPQYEDRRDRKGGRGPTIADAVGPQVLKAVNGAASKSGPLANLEAAYRQLVEEGGHQYEVATFFYDLVRRADQRARNVADELRKSEAKGQKPEAKDLQEAVSAVQGLRRTWAETVANPPSADWLVRAQLDGHFASAPKGRKPAYESILAMGETELRAAFVGNFSGEDAEARLTAKVETALAQIAFAKKATEIGLSLFEAAALSEEDLEVKGLTSAEITLVDRRLEAIAAKKAEREAVAVAKKTVAQPPSAVPDAVPTPTTLADRGNGKSAPAPIVAGQVVADPEERPGLVVVTEVASMENPKFKGFLATKAEAKGLTLEAYLEYLKDNPGEAAAVTEEFFAFIDGSISGAGKKSAADPKRKARSKGKEASAARNGEKPAPRRSRTREAAEE